MFQLKFDFKNVSDESQYQTIYLDMNEYGHQFYLYEGMHILEENQFTKPFSVIYFVAQEINFINVVIKI